MEFPQSEEEIIALAEKLIAGLTDNPDFPSPPVSAAELRKMLDSFIAARNAEAVAQAALVQATIAQKNALNALIDVGRRSAGTDAAPPARPILWN